MPIYGSLVATVGAATANSYTTVVEADDYHDGIVATYTSVWDDATSEQKEDSLMWATRLLDAWVDWYGDKTDEDQRLRWPRTDVTDMDGIEIDGDIIPQWLKEATAELARNLIAKDLTKEPLRGIKDLKVGSIAITFDMMNQKRVLLSSVRVFIRPYGRILEGGNLNRQVVRV